MDRKFSVVRYTFEPLHQDKYFSFIECLYSDYNHIRWYHEYIKKIFNKNNPSFHFIHIINFIAYKEETVVGHISAMIDSRLENYIGFFGFYECIEDKEVSSLLINEAVNYLREKGCKLIRGPINLTIWHTYRFAINQQKDTFIFEPINKNYYINQFLQEGFEVVDKYSSAQRSNFQTIIPYTKESYDFLVKAGFKIRTVSSETFMQDLLSIYKIAMETHKDSWSFVPLTKEEYIYLYKDYKNKIDYEFLEIISNSERQDVGSCFTIQDPINKTTLITKTIQVLPKYQEKGVGAALIYSQHKKAMEKGYRKFIYALIRHDNIITKMTYPGVSVIRDYATFEKRID